MTRTRVIAAEPAAIWEVISDAYVLPRWWPRVSRVEGVTETGFTEVMFSKRGRAVRLDHSYTEVEEPALLSWELELAGGPFDHMLNEWHTRIQLSPETAGTRVSIEERQSFRTSFATNRLMQRRAARRRLDEALTGLGELLLISR